MRLQELFELCAAVQKCEIRELHIQADHVHMLMQLRPDVSISKAVHLLKGVSSKVIRSEFPELKGFLWLALHFGAFG